MLKRPVLIVATVALALLAACGGSKPAPSAEAPTPAPPAAAATPAATDATGDDFRVGRPQTRSGIGDVDRAFARFEATRAELIDLFKAQPWFSDGLTREESLFVERSLSFVARYGGPRSDYLSDATVKGKLFRYARVPVASGEVELLLIFEPGQDADREIAFLKAAVPALEAVVGVEYPERVMTVFNGRFPINDFNDGQFIRIARCCPGDGFILAHELAHTYWTVGPAWFNEGMADIYAMLAMQRLAADPPAGWRISAPDIDAFYRARKAVASRFPDLALTRRFASDGLYEAADVFLLDIRRLVGPEAFAAAAREVYLASDFGRLNLREKRLEDVFLAKAGAGARELLMALFNERIWGDDGERYRQLSELDAP